MLRSLKVLKGYSIKATDGEIGKVDDFFFDDLSWVIRYLVVDTGKWLSGRKVLISAAELGEPDWESALFPVDITRRQVETSPDANLQTPVSRRREIELHRHYDWAPYWGFLDPTDLTGMNAAPISDPIITERPQPDAMPKGDPHLRSMTELLAYQIHAPDGDVGHVDDFIVDDDSWRIRYIVVDTRAILPGKKTLLAPAWISEISWDMHEMYADLKREKIENSPEFDPNQPINREYEVRLYDYYGRPRYWEEEESGA